MSTETSSTDPTEPVAASAPKAGTVKPDNQYNDIIATDTTAETGTTSAAKKKATQNTVLPDNQYNDSAPKG